MSEALDILNGNRVRTALSVTIDWAVAARRDPPPSGLFLAEDLEWVAGEIDKKDREIDRLRAALIGERERCARHVELIAADWREAGAHQKVWASEYLARQIRDLPASTESAAKKGENVG